MSQSNPQGDIIEQLVQDVARLRDNFSRTGDVTAHEFMRLAGARDDLADLLRLMYEKCIAKDD